MNAIAPQVALVKEPEVAWISAAKFVRLQRFVPALAASPRWRIERRNFERFDELLGRDVLNGFLPVLHSRRSVEHHH
jgi:hypothetical protein